MGTFIQDESGFVLARMVRQDNAVRAPLLARVRRAALVHATVAARAVRR